MPVINISGENLPKLDKMAEHWPQTIQQYWRDQEDRQMSLSARLLSESIRLNGASRPASNCLPSARVSFLQPIVCIAEPSG